MTLQIDPNWGISGKKSTNQELGLSFVHLVLDWCGQPGKHSAEVRISLVKWEATKARQCFQAKFFFLKTLNNDIFRFKK